MSSTTTVSVEKLARLNGGPQAPAIIDVRSEDEVAAERFAGLGVWGHRGEDCTVGAMMTKSGWTAEPNLHLARTSRAADDRFCSRPIEKPAN